MRDCFYFISYLQLLDNAQGQVSWTFLSFDWPKTHGTWTIILPLFMCIFRLSKCDMTVTCHTLSCGCDLQQNEHNLYLFSYLYLVVYKPDSWSSRTMFCILTFHHHHLRRMTYPKPSCVTEPSVLVADSSSCISNTHMLV